MDKQPSFAERTERMRESANALLSAAEAIEKVADTVHAEADQMAAAQKRFAERRNGDKRKASPPPYQPSSAFYHVYTLRRRADCGQAAGGPVLPDLRPTDRRSARRNRVSKLARPAPSRRARCSAS
jgi:hypothetical protein